MRPHSKVQLGRLISIGSVLFCLAELICLALIFAGCTSPFSPFNLYFMKIDFGKLTRTAEQIAPRSVATASAPVGSGANTDFGSLVSSIGPKLPEYYHVGLLSYCEGAKGVVNSCTGPVVSFSFSFGGIWQSLAASINKSVTQIDNVYLAGNIHTSQAIIALYMTAFITAFISLILGIRKIFLPGRWVPPLLSSCVSTALVIIATAWVISFYDFYTQRIEQVLAQYGASASLGSHAVASTCLAVFFSLASVFMNVWIAI